MTADARHYFDVLLRWPGARFRSGAPLRLRLADGFAVDFRAAMMAARRRDLICLYRQAGAALLWLGRRSAGRASLVCRALRDHHVRRGRRRRNLRLLRVRHDATFCFLMAIAMIIFVISAMLFGSEALLEPCHFRHCATAKPSPNSATAYLSYILSARISPLPRRRHGLIFRDGPA